jgi:hypothetical protein
MCWEEKENSPGDIPQPGESSGNSTDTLPYLRAGVCITKHIVREEPETKDPRCRYSPVL